MIKSGNPKQVRILAIAAIGAIGFMIAQFIPNKEEKVTPVEDASASSQTIDSHSLPTEVLGDPFAHSQLKVNHTENPPQQGEGEPTQPTRPPTQNPEFTGFGMTPLPGHFGQFQPGNNTPLTISPEENLANVQPSEQEDQKHVITLKAILGADEPRAFVSVDGGPTIKVAPGSEVTPGVTVKKITPKGVLFKTKNGESHVAVGGAFTG